VRLYVTNVTPQFQNFCYRLDFVPPGQKADKGDQQGFKRVRFSRGQQLPVGPDLPLEQLKPLIRQLEKLGAIYEIEVPRGLRNMVHPFVFNLDKNVSKRKAQDVVQHNREVRLGIGKDRRKTAAVAANVAISNMLEMNLGENPTQEVQVAIEQETSPGEGDMGSRIDEGYRVPTANDGSAPPPSRTRRSGGGRGTTRKAA
jgi:hypothetical protein